MGGVGGGGAVRRRRSESGSGSGTGRHHRVLKPWPAAADAASMHYIVWWNAHNARPEDAAPCGQSDYLAVIRKHNVPSGTQYCVFGYKSAAPVLYPQSHCGGYGALSPWRVWKPGSTPIRGGPPSEAPRTDMSTLVGGIRRPYDGGRAAAEYAMEPAATRPRLATAYQDGRRLAIESRGRAA